MIALGTITLCLWALVAADAFLQTPLGNTGLLLLALAALIALGVAISISGNLSSLPRMLALPALRYSMATHQAGHIVAAHLTDPTRIRRATLSDGCDRHESVVPIVTESALHAELMVTLGGIVAEEIFSGETGAYAAQDMARATDIAAYMVGSYGMAGSAVSLRSATRGHRKFLATVLEDPRARKDLEAVMRIARQDTFRALLEKRHVIIAVRDALIRRNRLSSAQIRTLIAETDRRRVDDDKVLVDLRVVNNNRPAAEAGS